MTTRVPVRCSANLQVRPVLIADPLQQSAFSNQTPWRTLVYNPRPCTRVITGSPSEAADAPGPFANCLLATTAAAKRTISGEGAAVSETQDWVFQAASGEHLELHITFERGVANRGAASETRFYSAKDAARVQLSKQEQVLEILRNSTTNPPDKVKAFSFKGAGGSYAQLFDGTDTAVSWDTIPWMLRSVSVP